MYLVNSILLEKGADNMCTLFEEIAAEGRKVGKIEGFIEILKKYNESDDSIIRELMSELQILQSEAEEYLDKYNKGTL